MNKDTFTFDNFGTSVWMDAEYASCALLKWLCDGLTGEELADIADADYGLDVEEHMEGLKDILLNKSVKLPLNWEPGEVLSLCSWIVTGLEEEKLSGRGHAFCSTSLLLAGWHPKGKGSNYASSANYYMSSILWYLQDHVDSHTYIDELFHWYVQEVQHHLQYDGQRIDAALAALGRLLLGVRSECKAEDLNALADDAWYFDNLAYAAKAVHVPEDSAWAKVPVLGLDNFGQHDMYWAAMAKDALNTLRKNNINAPSAIDLLSKIVGQ